MIELMIVVALVAIIAVIAIPNYQEYVLRSKRAAARQVLMESAQWLERNYTAAGCYDRSTTPDCRDRTGSNIEPPSRLVLAPSEDRASYRVDWNLSPSGTAVGQAYELRAIPCGDATGSNACPAGSDMAFKDPACGTLLLTQTGSRGATAGSVATCWQR